MNSFMLKFGLVVAGGAIQGLGMGVFLFPHSIPWLVGLLFSWVICFTLEWD
ncbi:hypothetical protein [Oceanobacillus caeni]|uniref:hypothetical protein n=1 Tax=Oceanobacillus caeni TaxID=405946 RepID=UPI002E2152B6|nr:hypothetical protein [Oceanobacillus caeni]